MKLKINLFLILLLASADYSNAQAQKTTLLSDETKVVYELNQSKEVDGTYSILKNDDTVLLRGLYKNNKRSGNWYAFNNDGTVFLRYNYNLKKLIHLDTVSINKLQIDIQATDPIIKERSSIPVPICSIDQFISLLGTELKRIVLKDNKNADGILKTDLIANIDEQGRATYQANFIADGIPVTKRLIIADRNFDIDWVPASYMGKAYRSSFLVKSKIDFSQKPGIKQRFIWVY